MSEVLRLQQPVRSVRVDPAAIAALEAEVGPELCAELVEDAVVIAADRLVAIERALDEEDWTRCARAARELAEAADGVGLHGLGMQAEALVACCAALDRTAAHAVGARVLRTGEAALACCATRPAG